MEGQSQQSKAYGRIVCANIDSALVTNEIRFGQLLAAQFRLCGQQCCAKVIKPAGAARMWLQLARPLLESQKLYLRVEPFGDIVEKIVDRIVL